MEPKTKKNKRFLEQDQVNQTFFWFCCILSLFSIGFYVSLSSVLFPLPFIWCPFGFDLVPFDPCALITAKWPESGPCTYVNVVDCTFHPTAYVALEFACLPLFWFHFVPLGCLACWFLISSCIHLKMSLNNWLNEYPPKICLPHYYLSCLLSLSNAIELSLSLYSPVTPSSVEQKVVLVWKLFDLSRLVPYDLLSVPFPFRLRYLSYLPFRSVSLSLRYVSFRSVPLLRSVPWRSHEPKSNKKTASQSQWS